MSPIESANRRRARVLHPRSRVAALPTADGMPSCSSSTRRVRLRPGAKGPGGGVAWTCLGSRTLPLRELCPSKIHHAASPERLPVHHQGDLFTWRPSPHTARPASLRMPYPSAPSGAVPAGANGARDKQPPEGGSSARPASVRQLRDAEDPQPRNARPAALALPSPRASCPRFDHRPRTPVPCWQRQWFIAGRKTRRAWPGDFSRSLGCSSRRQRPGTAIRPLWR